MPELNFNLLNPSAELYSGPQVKLDPQAAYEAAQAQQQSNMLSQLYAKHYDPQTGGINYNSLIGEAAQNPLTARVIPNIMGEAQKQAKAQADLSQTQAQQKQYEATAEAKQQETKAANLLAAKKNSLARLEMIDPNSPTAAQDMLNWHGKNHENPALQDYYKELGMSKDDTTAKFTQDLLQPDGVKKQYELIKRSLQSDTGVKAVTPEKLDTKEIVVGGRVKLVDMQTGKTIQDLGEAPRTAAQISASQAGDTGITVAERNKREAALPKAKAAFDASNEDIDLLITDLTTLSNHDGLKLITGARAGTGLAKGVTTVASQDAADAQALLNNIIAKGTLRSLVNLRNNSPTGGALGNVSDADVRLLKDSFAKLDTTQATKTFQNSLNDILDQLSSTKTRLKDAFDETYSYRSQNAPAASADTTNVSAKAPKIGDIVKGYKFKGGDPANQNSWEKVK